MSNIFTAKKEIPQSTIDITSGRPIITPPKELIDDKEEIITLPATVDFQIPEVKPVDLTDKEYKDLQTIFINAAKRAPNLKEVIKPVNKEELCLE